MCFVRCVLLGVCCVRCVCLVMFYCVIFRRGLLGVVVLGVICKVHFVR